MATEHNTERLIELGLLQRMPRRPIMPPALRNGLKSFIHSTVKTIADLQKRLSELESWKESILNDLDVVGHRDRPGEEEHQAQLEEELEGVQSEIDEIETEIEKRVNEGQETAETVEPTA